MNEILSYRKINITYVGMDNYHNTLDYNDYARYYITLSRKRGELMYIGYYASPKQESNTTKIYYELSDVFKMKNQNEIFNDLSVHISFGYNNFKFVLNNMKDIKKIIKLLKIRSEYYNNIKYNRMYFLNHSYDKTNYYSSISLSNIYLHDMNYTMYYIARRINNINRNKITKNIDLDSIRILPDLSVCMFSFVILKRLDSKKKWKELIQCPFIVTDVECIKKNNP